MKFPKKNKLDEDKKNKNIIKCKNCRRVFFTCLFIILTGFSFYKTFEIIDLKMIQSFINVYNLDEVLYLTLSISASVWTLLGLITILFTDGENIKDFWVKIIIRFIIYTFPFALPIIFLLYNFSFNSLIETSLFSGLIAFNVKTISEVDDKLMKILYRDDNIKNANEKVKLENKQK